MANQQRHDDPREQIFDKVSEVVATRLEQVSIDQPEEANQVFGRRSADGSTPIVITPRRTTKANAFALFLGGLMAFTGLFLWQIPVVWDYLAEPIIWSWFGGVTYWPIMLVLILIGVYPLVTMTIPSGVFALMTKHGRYIGIYEAGRHFLPPWYKISYMVTRQSTAYNAPVKNCPTRDNVMVKVDLLLVFHVEEPEAFVYKLGAEKFGDLLGSSAEEAIRGLVRGTTHEKAYELRGKGAGEMIQALNEQFQPFGVVFTSATITNVVLPEELAEALENQTVYESKKQEQVKHQEYELKVLNDREALAREELNKKNERLAADEEAKRDRQKIMKETMEIEAQKKKRISEIEAEEKASVLALQAEGELEAAQKQADSIRIRADAEADAARKIASQRAFELESKRLDLLRGLAANERLIISGNNGDNLIAQITAAARSCDIMGLTALSDRYVPSDDGASAPPEGRVSRTAASGGSPATTAKTGGAGGE